MLQGTKLLPSLNGVMWEGAEEVSHFRHRTQPPLQRRQARRQQEHAVTNKGEVAFELVDNPGGWSPYTFLPVF